MTDRPARMVRCVVAAAVLMVSLATAGGASAQLPAGTWQYQWGDDFSGTALDQTKWSYNYPWGNTHNHDAVMNPSNVVLGDGTLSLVATRTGAGADFTSGAVSTGYNKATFNGGYIEARILLPDTTGSWPAFWGLYSGWPPEADIMEYPIGAYAQDQYHTAFHYRNTSGGNSAGAGQVNPGGVGDLGGAYHTFGMEWREDDWVGFYFDGQLVSQFGDDAAIAQMQHMYLILNYAVGGWPGTPSTAQWPVGHSDEFKIDWVRVWQQAAPKTSNWAYSGLSSNVLWDTAGNWTNGAPNLGGITARFDTVNARSQFIDWSGRRTLSRILFDGSTRYGLGTDGDRLVLGYGSNGLLRPAIQIADSAVAYQQIDADLEFAGGLTLTHNSTVDFIINGDISGDGGIRVDGAGTVTFNGDNSYGGGTVIDAVGQGPATVRIGGKNGLGHGGTVVIGPAGNSTQARLELYNGGSVGNTINLHGRTNGTVGIQNLSGENTLAGTVQLQVGGDEYFIQSDAGTLRLSGDTATNGVSLRNMTTTARTVTLQGAGDVVVDGVIEDGAAPLSIAKTGVGVWTLNSQNTYTGTTTVSAGTLVVNGNTGSGETTLETGTTLAGGGTVRGNLQTQLNTTVRIGGASLPRVSASGMAMIDDFNDYPAGQIGATPNTTGDAWIGVFNGTANAEIISNAGDYALSVHGTNAASGWRGAVADLQSSFSEDFSLSDGETGTYFFRVRRNGTGTIDTIFGLTDQPATATSTPGSDTDSPWDEYAVLLSIFGDTSQSLMRAYSNGAGDINIEQAGNGVWLNVWLEVNNDTKTYRVATSTGDSDGLYKGGVFQFGRRTSATVGENPLVTFGFHEARNVNAELDDLYFTPGINLSNPLYAAVVPAGETLTVEGSLVLESTTTLSFDILNPATHDKLIIGGGLFADGILQVTLDPEAPAPAAGDSFDLIDFGLVFGGFNAFDLPTLGTGLKWDTSALLIDGVLSVAAITATPGDTDNDGDIDDFDLINAIVNYTGSLTPGVGGKGLPDGDTDDDGDVDDFDLINMIVGYTGSLPKPSSSTVPEPATLAALLIGLGITPGRRRLKR